MVEVNSENFLKCSAEVDQIKSLMQNVRKDTGLWSFPQPMLDHPDFKTLVEMGERIIPYLIHHITHEGSSLVILALLHMITGENPIPENERGRFVHENMRWLEWYVNSKYYPRNDVYFGLIQK